MAREDDRAQECMLPTSVLSWGGRANPAPGLAASPLTWASFLPRALCMGMPSFLFSHLLLLTAVSVCGLASVLTPDPPPLPGLTVP